jgi:hypothetical protein
MAAEPADVGDSEPEPFSPSDFLNLGPPTPRLDSPALQLHDDDDDLVLPFISRMLMEEETDGFFEQYHPDHPALLQAQQPFADILAGAAADGSRGTSVAGSPAFAANAIWPYDPVQLSQLLLSRTYPADTATYPSAAADLMASSAGSGAGAVNMDMLNLAFLKGMEEASKFLPATSNNHDHRRQATETCDKRVDGTSPLLQQSASKGRKNHRHAPYWGEDEEAETGRRSCKVMAVETEESEMVEEFVQSGYDSLHEQMMAMTLSTAGSRKGKGKGKGSANEAVDLRTLLIHCAQAVAAGNRPSAADLLGKIRARSSPRGDATQRLAHCFAGGLEARLAGTGTQQLTAATKRASAVEMLRAYQLYLAACSFTAMAYKFSNLAICKAVVGGGRKKVHIVDYGDHYYGFQWPSLLGYWGSLEAGPPEVRITAIDFPEPGFRPDARLQATGRRLTCFARRHGVPLRFHGIEARWDAVSVDELSIERDEVLVVNGLFSLGRMQEQEQDDVDRDSRPSPRDTVLGNVRKMRPDVFVLCVENSSYGAPLFVTRFREALFYYSALFDMMDAVAARDDDDRVLVEQHLFGQRALNAIACEGSDRVERPETYRQWQVRNERAGLRQLPLDPDAVRAIRRKVKDKYHRDLFIDEDQQWLLQGWKGRVLYAMSAWAAK